MEQFSNRAFLKWSNSQMQHFGVATVCHISRSQEQRNMACDVLPKNTLKGQSIVIWYVWTLMRIGLNFLCVLLCMMGQQKVPFWNQKSVCCTVANVCFLRHPPRGNTQRRIAGGGTVSRCLTHNKYQLWGTKLWHLLLSLRATKVPLCLELDLSTHQYQDSFGRLIQ